jgi:hypothetical protein
MLFIENKYTKWYYNIIISAQSRTSVVGYTEKHHIIPKSLGGDNSSSNLVRLSGREHFVCHWLLTKMVNNTRHKFQLAKALNCMQWLITADQERYKISGRKFENIRENYSKIFSENQKGKHNHMYGKIVSAETREKLAIANTNRHASEATRQKISDALKGRTFSAETRDKISIANKGKPSPMYGRTHTADARKKISDSNKGKLTGNANPMYGNTHTIESRQKISEKAIGRTPWNKGITHSDETKAKLSAAGKNRAPISEETRAKIVASHQNRAPISEETRAKMAVAAKERVFQTVVCQYCGLSGKGGNMTRWHGNNCKQKN